MTAQYQHEVGSAADVAPAAGGEPLIGVENIPPPEWAASGAHVAKAGL